MTYSYHRSANFCHPQPDFWLENDDVVRSHLESHVCANGDDHLTEMNDDVFSRTNGDGSFDHENGGDQTLYSTISGVVTCHANLSLRTESDLYIADPYIAVGNSSLDRGGRWISVISSNDDRSCSALWLEADSQNCSTETSEDGCSARIFEPDA